MKLLRLQLERFGHFHGAALDFGDGLQLVHGRNEAGKSTLLAALRALLFQFPRGQYDFRFSDATLALSAKLAFSDGALAEVRREKNKGWKGQLGAEKLSDDAFRQRLGHPSQELFANVFAFGLSELASGAESIVAAGLGAALSGSGVGAGVGPEALAAELKKQADELFLEKGKRPINVLIADIKERQKALRETQLRGENFRALEDALAAEKERAADLRRRREALLRRVTLLESALRALPARQALAGARLALSQLGPVAPLPASAEAEFRRLAEERDRLSARAAELDARLARTRGQLDALIVDEPRPEDRQEAARLTTATDGWSGHLERREQLEAAHADHDRLRDERERLRAQLDPPWGIAATESVLPVPRVEEVRRHKSLLDGLARKHEAAARDRERLARELKQAEEQALQRAEEAPSPDELTRLRAERDALWERIRKSWLEGALTGGEGSGPLFGQLSARQLAGKFAEVASAADHHADELRRRSTEVAQLLEATARREERARALAASERELAQASAALAEGEAAWRELWSRCGFLPHSPDAMIEWLADYHALGESAAQLKIAGDRAARLEAATGGYEATLRAALGGEQPIDRLYNEARKLLGERAQREQERIRAVERRTHLSHALDELTLDRAEVRTTLAAREAELAAWRARAAAGDDERFLAAAGAARQAHELNQEIARAERTLAEISAGVVEAELDQSLARGRQALDAEKSELAAERTRLDAELQETDRRVGAAEAQLARLDGGSQTIELQSILESKRAELRDRAGEWARLTIARTLLERQMARFSARQQPGLLESVSRLFAAMTHGRYTRVQQRLDEQFVALRADGVEVAPAALSTGTREQLYLAVRLAYVESYAARNEPLPLILDDVLVNFDDERAAATLAVLGQFAAAGRAQVLLLTCHAHLVELARAAIPSLIPTTLPPA